MLDIHDEIQAALSEPVAPSTDADLEKELAALLLDSLPNPPIDSPKQEHADNKVPGTYLCLFVSSILQSQCVTQVCIDATKYGLLFSSFLKYRSSRIQHTSSNRL